MMLRKLLACLALLTGLTAAGAPVQARLMEALSAQVQSSQSISEAQAQQSHAGSAAALLFRAAPSSPPSTGMHVVDVLPEPVLTGIDRARE